MKLSPAEYKLLNTLTLVVDNALPMEWLAPARRAMVIRMRSRGLLSKRHPDLAKATQFGLKAHRRQNTTQEKT